MLRAARSQQQWSRRASCRLGHDWNSMPVRRFCKHAVHWSAVVQGSKPFWIHTQNVFRRDKKNNTVWLSLTTLIWRGVFVTRLQNSNERRDMYSRQSRSRRRQRHSLARKEPGTFASRNTKGDLTIPAQSFTKRSRKRIRQTGSWLVGTRVERQISGRLDFENRHFQCACSLVYINKCYKCYRFPILLAWYFEKFVFKYFSWHSVDRSYVGIWFVLNNGVIFSKAATLSS